MTTRRPNPRLVKIHRNYTVDEIAKLFTVHRNTVRNWLKSGLQALDGLRPTLVVGSVLAEYLHSQRRKRKSKCQPGEMYCLRCRTPKVPAGQMAEYRPFSATRGQLIGLCPDCDLLMHRCVSPAKLQLAQGSLEVTISKGLQHIVDTSSRLLNCDFNMGVPDHEKS